MLLPTFLLSSIALSSAISLPRAFIPNTNATDSVNASIAAYTDPILKAIAADPALEDAYATATFSNGPRAKVLNEEGAYFHFRELKGHSGLANLTTLVIKFGFPGGLSSTNNIFAYHIHENSISADDSTCNSAGAHLDPFKANGTQPLQSNVTSAPASEGPSFNRLYHPTSGNLSTFQTGDLSGKYGLLTTLDGIMPGREIVDHYLRITGNYSYSIAGRSVVIHDAVTDTRIACGNISRTESYPS